MARQAELEEFTSFVLGSQRRMVRLAELLTGAYADEFFLRQDRNGQSTGYVLPGSMRWRNAYGVWQDGTRPACMRPLTRGQHITIGVVNAAPIGDAPGGSVLVWLECPRMPIPRYPIVTPSAAISP